MRELVGSKNTIGQNGLSVEKAPKSDLYLFFNMYLLTNKQTKARPTGCNK